LKVKYTYLFVLFFLFCGCSEQKHKLPLLSETYRKDDTRPFGGYVTFQQIKKLFYTHLFIKTNETKPFDSEWEQIRSSSSRDPAFYILIAKNLALTSDAAEAMSEFVKDGNDLFISADYIDEKLQTKFNFQTEREDEIVKEVNGIMKPTSVKSAAGSNAYGYYYYPFLNYFTIKDNANARILGRNENGQPDYIVIFAGKGRLYLHIAPRAFSNYFLLSNTNYQYLQEVFSYTRPESRNIYWDDYYSNYVLSSRNTSGDGNGNNFSSFSVINNNPALKWAFWLSIIAALLYILFNIKRKQRIIPVREPNINTTVVFAETVGRLYLEKKNNKNIAEKMITYFYEQVRNKYFMNTNVINEEFISSLSRKSGVSLDLTRTLLNAIRKIQTSPDVSDTELLLFNEQLQNFNTIK
jgi:hypothetical protein